MRAPSVVEFSFSENNDPNVGRPKDENLLFSIEEIKKDFGDLKFLELYEAVLTR